MATFMIPEALKAQQRETLIRYVMRYGGTCRDCADRDGVCFNGVPCDSDQLRAAVEHTLAALEYGTKHGYAEGYRLIAPDTAYLEQQARKEEPHAQD